MKKAQHPEPIIINPLDIFPTAVGSLSKNLTKIKNRDEIKIVYFGTPEFSAYILEKLIEFCQNPIPTSALHPGGGGINLPRFSIQTVVTRADKPAGRSQTVKSSPVALVAKKYGIPVLKPTKLDNDFITSHLAFLTCDLFIVASYGKIIPQALLDTPKLGSLNVHGSILPKYRGASPIQVAILNGEKETGITIMLMDQEMDHGPVLNTKKISISEQDTYLTLSNKMMQEAPPLLIETMVKFIQGEITPKPQNHSQATFTKIITKDDSYFDINTPPPPIQLDRMIRAYYPWPGVWTKWQGKIIKFLPENKIQMEGKKVLSKKDFLNGYRDFPLQ